MIARRVRAGTAGFTLLEAMLSVALMGAIVMVIASVTAQWLPNWRRGFANLQRADLLSLGLERIAQDVSGAEVISPKGLGDALVFEGRTLSLTFVRAAFGPNEAPHLEVVRIAETVDDRGFALVRTRAPFTPQTELRGAGAFAFGDPVVLARAPFRVSFAYADSSRRWTDAWPAGPNLPEAVRISVRDAASGQLLAASTAVTMKVTGQGVRLPPPADQPDTAGLGDPAQPQ